MPNLQGKIELIKQAQVDIKNAIIDKGLTPTGNISTYADAIDNIVTPNNQTKTVTENGVVRYDAGYTGLEQVTVDVNQSVQNKNITTNGTYTADSGYVGLGVVTVDVSPDVTTKIITANGTYNASSDNADGYSSVIVNIQDNKKMNYWEDISGNYHNFLLANSTICLDVGATTLDNRLTPVSPSCVLKVNFSAITKITSEISAFNLEEVFSGCSYLCFVDFSSLSEIKSYSCFANCFENCTLLTELSFPSLNSNSFGSYTNQFDNMLRGVTGCTVHFPSNLQSVIGRWSSVTLGFGGTNTTVLFDLPATT